MNYNDRDDMDMNGNLQNGGMSRGIGRINNHTLPQYNESSNLNEMNWGVENGDISGVHCYMNSYTLSEAKNHKSIYSTKKSDEVAPIISEMKILNYRMVLTFMLCYLHTNFINMLKWNNIINIITP